MNGQTISRFLCPHCGNFIDLPGSAKANSDSYIESLHQEIRRLRETVAYLRGSSASWPQPPLGGSHRNPR